MSKAATRTQIKATMRAARAAAFRLRYCERSSRHWEAESESDQQASGLRPWDDKTGHWSGDFCSWADVLAKILPGESCMVNCYQDAFGFNGELDTSVGIFLSQDGLHADIEGVGAKCPRVRVV